MIYLIISQFLFSFSRTLNVRYTATENVLMSIITSAIIKISWLASAAIGINAVLEKDWTVSIVYVVSGVIGDYLSFKIKINGKTKASDIILWR